MMGTKTMAAASETTKRLALAVGCLVATVAVAMVRLTRVRAANMIIKRDGGATKILLGCAKENLFCCLLVANEKRLRDETMKEEEDSLFSISNDTNCSAPTRERESERERWIVVCDGFWFRQTHNQGRKRISITTQQTRHLPCDILQSFCGLRLARRSAMFRPCSSIFGVTSVFLFHVSKSLRTKLGHSSSFLSKLPYCSPT